LRYWTMMEEIEYTPDELRTIELIEAGSYSHLRVSEKPVVLPRWCHALYLIFLVVLYLHSYF